MARLIVPLRHRAARDAALCGGKGAALARLLALGFDVPDGFVLTTAAYRLAHASGALPREVPPVLLGACAAAYGALGGRVAVRSSAESEDGSRRSQAGAFETVLDVLDEEALARAIVTVWRSGDAPLLAGALATEASGRDGFAMAVVVQKQVEPVASGVAFSADPLTGQPHVVIEAVPGRPGALVRGRAAPDRFVVDARGALAEEHRAAVDPAVLPAERLLELAALVRKAAQGLGGPQDVEWAWDGAALRLLQSRPITSLAGKHVYTRLLVADMSPGLVKPLLWSTNTQGIVRRVFSPIFAELLGEPALDCLPTLRRFRSRVYMDATEMGRLLERAGLPVNFFEMTARGQHAASHPRPSLRLVARLPRVARFALREGRAASRIEAHAARADRELAAFRGRDWSGAVARELQGAADRLFALHADTQWFVFLAALNLALRMRVLQRFLRRHAPGVDSADLVRGLTGMKTLEPNARLQLMGLRAAALDAGVRETLLDGNDSLARAALGGFPDGEALVADVDAFLARFGYLRPHGVDFSEPGWAENAGAVWAAIGRMAADPPARPASGAREQGERSAAAVRAKLGGLRRRAFDALFASAKRHIALRERLSLLMTEDVHETRRVLLAAGERLAAESRLERAEDVFFLEPAELREALAGTLDDPGVIARRRRASYDADACVELPETFAGEEPPVHLPASPAADGSTLGGIPASAGIARGIARVVLDPGAVRGRLTREDILVIPFTDTAWTPLFPTVGGVVAESGGQLSHTAIVAREYGLPTVVGVKDATRLLRDGQPVTVDGTRGRVHLRRLAAGEEER